MSLNLRLQTGFVLVALIIQVQNNLCWKKTLKIIKSNHHATPPSTITKQYPLVPHPHFSITSMVNLKLIVLTSLGSSFKLLIILSVKKFFPMPNQSFLWCSMGVANFLMSYHLSLEKRDQHTPPCHLLSCSCRE